MTIGEKIRKIRLEKKLTQKEVGERCEPKIAESTIRRYELGDLKSPKPITIQRIAKGLGVSYDELIEGTESPETKKYIIRPYRIKGLPNFDSVSMPKQNSNDILQQLYYEILKRSVSESYEDFEDEKVFIKKINVSEIKNLPINRAFEKLKKGEPLDSEETQALKDFGGFQHIFGELSESTRKLANLLRKNYELLNEKGQKKADKHIRYAVDQIELLTKIPEYRKED